MRKLAGTQQGANDKILKNVYLGSIGTTTPLAWLLLMDDSSPVTPGDSPESPEPDVAYHHRCNEINSD
jgi:hypothetical protein